MGEYYYSEERTEPFSQAEIDSRLKNSIRVPEDLGTLEDDTIPLDKLIIDDKHRSDGIRILVRPLTRSRSVSPGSDNCKWLALRAEVAAADKPETKVLAVTQTHKDINFALRIPGESGVDETRPPFGLSLAEGDDDDTNFEEEMVPGNVKELCPASWRLSVYGTAVIDFRILTKRAASLWIPRDPSDISSATIGGSDVLNSSLKRSFSEEDDGEGIAEKRLRTVGRERCNAEDGEDDDGVIVFYPRTMAEPLVFPLPNAATSKEVAISGGQALLQVQKDQTIAIPGGLELDQYQLTKRNQIATTAASTVFTAEHSKVSDVPDGVITVKVLKTRGPNNAKSQDSHRNVIRQADVWLREYRSQEDMQHESIVKLYGGDARYLSLYMEHVDGKDLAARSVWRDAGTDIFTGDRTDAVRILKDIAGALNYVHQRRRVHNDIKPANILYSRDRGAVLCDFGLSTLTNDAATNGGTPYYVPPEFIGKRLRGSPSDVWAMGVTMLYVLKKITFPDARGRQGHPKQLYWMIADLNRRTPHHHHHSGKGISAVSQMQQWLNEVNEAKSKLNPRDKLHVLVSQMLTPNPIQRITMAKVMAELIKDATLDQ
ncbi:Serine/threonine-protein kinase ULK1 [Apiospora kogelbergensis]|uniref:Serine/threonine-protein kinase ULK1 n=1 Tax=Apiospora kogelbergensis TaxID=1337665 RepID=A0AAW0QDC4_9PEZI